MQTWIDNTGLHSAGLCLDGRANASHDLDVRGLLQLATLLVFSNRIELCEFGRDPVNDRSREIAESLVSIGVAREALSVVTISEGDYARACNAAAEAVAAELEGPWTSNEATLLGLEAPDVPKGPLEGQIRFMELALTADQTTLVEVRESALRGEPPEALDFMAAASVGLREVIRRLVKATPSWSPQDSYQLGVVLRYHLNEALAQATNSRYAPAVGRGRVVERRSAYALELLGDAVTRVAGELRGAPLGISSTSSALLARSRGEPAAIVSEALELRQRSKPLRDALLRWSQTFDDSPSGRFELRKEINELAGQLRREVGLQEPTRLYEAIELKFVLGVPIISISSKAAIGWLEERLKHRHVAVLTDLVKDAAFADDKAMQNFSRLRKLASRRA
jgi:hypothetical protein